MKFLAIFITILGWISLAVRFYLNLTTIDLPTGEITIRFFSYFTILTNLLVTIYCTYWLTSPKRKSGNLFRQAEALTALTVFISIVAVVYHLLLKADWNPQGMDWVLSEIHHTLIPMLTFLLWIISSERTRLNFSKLLAWLLYPAIYLTLVLTRASFSGFYPYPFIDVDNLGINKVVVNSAGLLIVMVLLLLIFGFLGKRIPVKNPR